MPCPAFLWMVTLLLTWISMACHFFFPCKFRTVLHSCQGYFFQNSTCLQKEVQFIIRNLTFQINSTLLKSKDQLPFFFFSSLFWYVCVIQVTEFRKELKTGKNYHVVFWYRCKPSDSKEKGTFLQNNACPIDPDKFNCLILISINAQVYLLLLSEANGKLYLCWPLFQEDCVFMHL